MNPYLILAVGWIVYFLLHSLLASNFMKARLQRRVSTSIRYYRIIYSLISSLGLLALLVYNGSIKSTYVLDPIGLSRYVSLMLATLGVIIIMRAFREYSLLAFLGFRPEPHAFNRMGILSRVRHPIYSGTILIVIGFMLFYPTWATLLSTVCVLTYLPIGIYLEERKLVQQFGDDYRNYQQTVPALIPRLKIF